MITVLQTTEFAKWLKRLKDAEARARILVRIRRLSLTENFGDARPVGDGVYEMRVAAALGDVARAKGMTQLSKETGITRDGLYKALSPTGNPSFDTVQKVIKAFGLRLDVATSA